MPYFISKEGQRRYVVRKRISGKRIGVTTSRDKARSMIAAIEASEHRGKGKRGR